MLNLLITLLNSFDHSLYKSIYIFLISFFSNIFSGISGGGAGLIQLPALILSGIPYYQALASHKFATVALGIGGSLRNYKSLRNDIFVAYQILIFGLPGVIIGAFIVEYISEQYLYLFLGVISILLAYYSFHKSDLGLSSKNNKLYLVQKIRFLVFLFLIGILNGSISSGTGLLVTILLIKTCGMDFIRAVSLTFLLLIIGSFTGGFLGAHLSKLKGNKLIKNTFTTVCFFVGISLLIKSFKSFL